ncbi:MAG: hypothetical protein R3F37_22720 [Candidatus Competibacteraceae bacterium]
MSRIQGTRFTDLEADQRELAALAWNPRKTIEQRWVVEIYSWWRVSRLQSEVVQTLQTAVNSGEQADYRKFAELVNQRPAASLRDLFQFRALDAPIPIEEVEPIEAILRVSIRPACRWARCRRKPMNPWR